MVCLAGGEIASSQAKRIIQTWVGFLDFALLRSE